jgi:hypothetical protein
MELALAFIGLPVFTYLALAAVPRGRPALIAILGAAAIAAVVWVTQGMGSGDSFLIALIGFVFSAIALAGIVQLIRAQLRPGMPRWVYPALVATALVVAGIPMLTVLGL